MGVLSFGLFLPRFFGGTVWLRLPCAILLVFLASHRKINSIWYTFFRSLMLVTFFCLQ